MERAIMCLSVKMLYWQGITDAGHSEIVFFAYVEAFICLFIRQKWAFRHKARKETGPPVRIVKVLLLPAAKGLDIAVIQA
jgi:hypothetical protein